MKRNLFVGAVTMLGVFVSIVPPSWIFSRPWRFRKKAARS